MKKINLKKFKLRIFKKLPAHEKRITIPTIFTLFRFVFVPIIIGAMIIGHWGIAFGFFLAASITDLIDGGLARILNEKTFLGACLDPLADKLLLLSIFFTLAVLDTPLFHIPKWFFILALSKEIIQIAGAILVYNLKGHLDVRPTILGKMTTFAQIGFITWLFACYFFEWMPIKTYYTMLGIMLCMVFASFIQYFTIGLTALQTDS